MAVGKEGGALPHPPGMPCKPTTETQESVRSTDPHRPWHDRAKRPGDSNVVVLPDQRPRRSDWHHSIRLAAFALLGDDPLMLPEPSQPADLVDPSTAVVRHSRLPTTWDRESDRIGRPRDQKATSGSDGVRDAIAMKMLRTSGGGGEIRVNPMGRRLLALFTGIGTTDGSWSTNRPAPTTVKCCASGDAGSPSSVSVPRCRKVGRYDPSGRREPCSTQSITLSRAYAAQSRRWNVVAGNTSCGTTNSLRQRSYWTRGELPRRWRKRMQGRTTFPSCRSTTAPTSPS